MSLCPFQLWGPGKRCSPPELFSLLWWGAGRLTHFHFGEEIGDRRPICDQAPSPPSLRTLDHEENGAPSLPASEPADEASGISQLSSDK